MTKPPLSALRPMVEERLHAGGWFRPEMAPDARQIMTENVCSSLLGTSSAKGRLMVLHLLFEPHEWTIGERFLTEMDTEFADLIAAIDEERGHWGALYGTLAGEAPLGEGHPEQWRQFWDAIAYLLVTDFVRNDRQEVLKHYGEAR